MNGSERKRADLRRELQRIRGEVSLDINSLGGQLNMTQRLRNSIRENQGKWILGGAGLGLVLALAFNQKKRRGTGSGLRSGILRSLFLGLLGSATKQILRESVPVIAKMTQDGLKQWIGNFDKDPPDSGDTPQP